MNQMPAIRVSGLFKHFGTKEVLRGVDLEVQRGESVVLVGGSGAGKTVFLKHLIGLIRPDEGSVEVMGRDLDELTRSELLELRKRFGMSFQEGALFDSMSVFDNVAFPIRRHRHATQAEVTDRVEACLQMVRLEGVEAKLPAELSGGMRRRVGFARAIALEPEILLFDEPTTGLDPINTAAIATVINRLRAELDITAVTITHDMQLASRIADRIAMLRRGRILAVADPETFIHLDEPYIQAFLNGEVPPDEEGT
jgi:phospholipid/cholesterol/gamma-HCH transport system ATP-binding protein